MQRGGAACATPPPRFWTPLLQSAQFPVGLPILARVGNREVAAGSNLRQSFDLTRLSEEIGHVLVISESLHCTRVVGDQAGVPVTVLATQIAIQAAALSLLPGEGIDTEVGDFLVCRIDFHF